LVNSTAMLLLNLNVRILFSDLNLAMREFTSGL
jgi:hypothetical protein